MDWRWRWAWATATCLTWPVLLDPCLLLLSLVLTLDLTNDLLPSHLPHLEDNLTTATTSS